MSAINQSHQKDALPMGEMNSTPLIDVMLVLLIMFIITIPPVTHAVKIDLPTGPKIETLTPDPVINKVVILPDRQILWNGTPVSLDQLTLYLDQTKTMKPIPELQFQPAATAQYDIVDFVLARIKASQIEKFGFVGNEKYAKFDKSDIM